MPRNHPKSRRRQRIVPPRDPAPWENARRPPTDRPRHENAEPDDPAQSGEAIAAESFGEVVEVCRDGTVDGDFNGNPELESLADTAEWEGVDALQGMKGREQELPRESRSATEVLADAVADRRRVLIERLDDARELGVGPVFEAVIASTDPSSGSRPIVSDDEVLRDQLELIDAALAQLEGKAGQE
jgi:hypothetical protein